jgi:CRP-like cAMP-binding protein
MSGRSHRLTGPRATLGNRMPTVTNHLLDLLPRKDRRQLLANCEPVQLAMTEVLCEPGTVTRHVYFPTEGFISLITSIDGKPVLEVGMVGAEGMLGAQLLMGVKVSPLHAMVQGSGGAWRVSASDFRAELARSVPLQRWINRYLYVLMGQLATSAGCLRFHNISQRLARWLLMTQDRAHKDSFHITHEFLSYMLGVRRVGITNTAGELQRRGLIDYNRGELTVLNRRGLESTACSCYEVDRQAYAEILN